MTLNEKLTPFTKKKEAVAKYFSDFLRTIGTAMMFFSILGILLDRPEVVASASSLAMTVAIGVFGLVSVGFGSIIVLLSTLEES